MSFQLPSSSLDEGLWYPLRLKSGKLICNTKTILRRTNYTGRTMVGNWLLSDWENPWPWWYSNKNIWNILWMIIYENPHVSIIHIYICETIWHTKKEMITLLLKQELGGQYKATSTKYWQKVLLIELSDIIHHNQTGILKWRYFGDNIRQLLEIMQGNEA